MSVVDSNYQHEIRRSQIKRGLLKDFTDALGQQLLFWGRDVIHSDGNLLCEYGLERRKSEGLDGTSCYSMPYQGDIVELHGACVGRYSEIEPSFLYIRNRKRCFLYDGAEPPAPELYLADSLSSDCFELLYDRSKAFLSWWLEYEAWIATVTSPDYRQQCFRAFRRLPKSKSWLPPAAALEWLQAYATEPADDLRRAKLWKAEA